MTDTNAVPIEALLAESDWVRRLAESLVHDKTVADDIVQQTWLAALKRPPATDRPLRPWLRTVVENFVKMRGRGEAARTSREQAASRPEGIDSSEGLVARVETQRMLGGLVLELEEPFRTTVILRYYEGLSSAEIARRTGAPEGTVRWRLKRGLEVMRERLDRRHGGDRDAWCALLTPLFPRAELVITSSAIGWPLLLALLFCVGGLAAAVVWYGGRTERPFEAATMPTNAPQDTRSGEGQERIEAPAPRENANMVATRDGSSEIVAHCVDARTRAPVSAEISFGEHVTRSDADGLVRIVVPCDAPRWSEWTATSEGRVTVRVGATLEPGRIVELGELRFERAGAIRGLVLAPDGRAAAGALVRAEVIGSRWQTFDAPPLEEARHLDSMLPADAPRSVCDAFGRFELSGLPESFVRLWVSAPGCETIWTEAIAVFGGEVAETGAVQLVAFDPKNCIEGVVFDPDGRPVANARVEAARRSIRAALFSGASSVISARTDSDGRFRLCVDPQSRYEVAAVDASFAWRPSLADDVAPGTRELVLKLSPWRRFEVRASTADGSHPADLRVEFSDARNDKPLELVDGSGNVLTGVAPYRDFNVTVRARGCATSRAGPFGRDDAPGDLNVILAPFGGLHGTVSAGGEPIAGAIVEVIAASMRRNALQSHFEGWETFSMNVERPWRSFSTRSDEEGRFGISVDEQHSYFLRVRADGYATALVGPFEIHPAFSMERSVELIEGGALVGHVVRTDAEPIAGTVVAISCGDGYVRTRRVGADGAYRFEHLTPGRWQVRPFAREVFGEERLEFAALGTTSAPWDVEIRADASSTFDLVVSQSRRCRVRGSLQFDGASIGPWTVSAQARNSPISRTIVGPRGEFELDLPAAGEWTLSARSTDRSGVHSVFVETLSVQSGTTEFARSWSRGEIELRGTVGASATFVWEQSGARLQVTAEIRPGTDVSIVRLPVGQVRLEREDAEPMPIEVVVGERRVITLP